MRVTRRLLLGLAGAVATAARSSAGLAAAPDQGQPLLAKLAPYLFADTRRLVALVEDAGTLLEREGERAFAEFAVQGSRWFNGENYLFAYAVDGTCVFHAATPGLVGQHLIDLKDLNGRPVIRRITDVGQKPEPDASGWIFYLWQDGTQLSPSWKSSYVRKAMVPDRRTLIVGSGVYNLKIERIFVEERVANAVTLLEVSGKEAAFRAFQDPATPFNFLDTFIFVLDGSGHTLVDPAFPNHVGRDLSGFTDAVGFPAVAELLRKLRSANEAWVQFLWPRPGEALPSRKLIYARNVKVGDETLIVGSDYFLPTPIWMRV
jgi:signal transduction histidine kinase